MYLILTVLLYIICINNEFKLTEDNEDKIANIKIVHKNLPSVSYQFIIIIYIKLVFTVISSTIKVYSFIFWQNILR